MTDVGSLRYLYTARIEERDGSYVIEVPKREVEEGSLEVGERGQIGIFSGPEPSSDDGTARTPITEEPPETATADDGPDSGTEDEAETATADEGASSGTASAGTASPGPSAMESLDEVEVRDPAEPPVDEGERREVEIDDVGEQGDGLARIDRGYVVFVPDTEPGDTVEIEITDTKENFGFGELVE